MHSDSDGSVIELDDSNFQLVRNESSRVVLLRGWAPWCASCRVMEKHVFALGEAYPSALLVAQLNIDRHPDLTRQLNIRYLPELLIWMTGRELGRIIGEVTAGELWEQLIFSYPPIAFYTARQPCRNIRL